MHRGRSAGEHEDSCSDDRSNTKRNQVRRTERTPQTVFAAFLGLLHNDVQRLLRH